MSEDKTHLKELPRPLPQKRTTRQDEAPQRSSGDARLEHVQEHPRSPINVVGGAETHDNIDDGTSDSKGRTRRFPDLKGWEELPAQNLREKSIER